MVVAADRLVVGHDEVPAVETGLAPVDGQVARCPVPLRGRVADQVSPFAAVDARDDLGDLDHSASLVPRLPHVRVVAGSARGVKLVAPKGDDTRPTSDRVREAVFNALFSLGGVEGWTVADLFAGTGAMGIEALSRGAGHCTFVERARPARRAIEENLSAARLADRATVEGGDATGFSQRVDLVVADPPYRFDGWAELLATVDADWIVVESDREIELGDRWTNVRQRTYGGTVVSIARRATTPPPGDSA